MSKISSIRKKNKHEALKTEESESTSKSKTANTKKGHANLQQHHSHGHGQHQQKINPAGFGSGGGTETEEIPMAQLIDMGPSPPSTFLQLHPPSLLSSEIRQTMQNERKVHIPRHSEEEIEIQIPRMNVIELEQLQQRANHDIPFSDEDKEAMVDQLFPPKDISYNLQKLRYIVSKVPADSEDRMQLFKKFERITEERSILSKHTEVSYCPITYVLLQDLFDECLRQEVLSDFPERGIALAHIRNGLNQIAETYTALVETAQLKEMRTSTALDTMVQHFEALLENDETEISRMEAEIAHLRTVVEAQKHEQSEERKKKAAKHHEEVDFLKRVCHQCQNQVAHFDLQGKGKSHHHHHKEEENKVAVLRTASGATDIGIGAGAA